MKIKAFIPFLIAISIFSVAAVFQNAKINNNLMINSSLSYEQLWKKADSLANKGLYKSANEYVIQIKQKAKAETNNPQFVKAIINSMKYAQMLEEDFFANSLKDIEKEIVEAKDIPLKSLLHSIAAEMYSGYLNSNYQIMNRTEVVDNKSEDIATWDKTMFYKVIAGHYLKSVEEVSKLSNTEIVKYEIILNEIEDNTKIKQRPTLFDLLADRAMRFFKDVTFAPKPIVQFDNTIDLLSAYPDFIQSKFAFNDSLDKDFAIAQIYQKTLKLHKGLNNPIAIIDWDIDRLNYYKYKVTDENKDSIYLKSMAVLENNFKSMLFSLEATYEIANYWKMEGDSYSIKNMPARWYKAKALEIIVSHLNKFVKSESERKLEYLKAEILSKSISLNVESANIPNKAFRALINYRNLNHVFVRVIQTDPEKLKSRNQNEEQLIDDLKKMKVFKQFDYALPDEKDYQNHSCEIKMPELPAGHYSVLISNISDFDYINNAAGYANIWVSDISYISKKNDKGEYEFYVVSRTSGEPISGVTAQLYSEKYNNRTYNYDFEKGRKFVADSKGYFVIPAPKEYEYFKMELFTATDRLMTNNNYYLSKHYDNAKGKRTRTHFYTDRAIYRPGQTIYFKGVVLEYNENDSMYIKPNFKTKVNFFDVNYQKIADVDVTCNEYGSFSGSFIAPTGLLNGRMTISNESGSAQVNVEEYKRPKFQVIIDNLKKECKINDDIELTGSAMAYAGNSIDGASVKYHIVRTVSFPRWWYWYNSYSGASDKEIANGTAKTDADGKYTFNFKAVPDITIAKKSSPTFNYRVEIEITDINGETHAATKNINVSYQSLFVDIDIPEMVNAENDQKYGIKSENINGAYQHSKGSISVHQLKQPSNPLRSRIWAKPDVFIMNEEEFHKNFPNDVYNTENDRSQWQKEKLMMKIDYNTKADSILNLSQLAKWEPGVYLLNIESTDKDGNKVESASYFTVYSPKAKTIPVNTAFWQVALKSKCEPGEKAQLLIGTKEKNLKVLYEIEFNGKTVHSEWLNLNNEQRLIEIPVKEEYRGNFVVHFNGIANNDEFSENVLINVPRTNKQLDITFETFRSKLIPGQDEEWKIKIKGKNGDKVAAEMLAAMYDASLDEFAANRWNFDIYNTYYSQISWAGSGLYANSAAVYANNWHNTIAMPYNESPTLNWFGFYGRVRWREDSHSISMSASSDYFVDGVVMEENAKMDTDQTLAGVSIRKSKDEVVSRGWSEKAADKPVQAKEEKSDNSSVSPRTNFNETAFFFPHLTTDENGSVIIAFKVPESLTKWKFMGFAHTKDLKYGMALNEAVTQKELMVFPNFPRFFREGDTLHVSAKISNLSQETQQGEAILSLSDASTMRLLNNEFKIANNTATFSADKGKSTVVEWKIVVPQDISTVTCKVIAKSGNFSDGEEFILPVITNRMLVAESLPLPIRGNQSKIFTFQKLVNTTSPTLTNHKMTLEFTSNPAWYAVQALPYMMEYPYECAEQTFSRLYANGIAAYLANSNPKIKQVFDAWSNYTPDALLSNLAKNQELKSVLLQETPWVLDAKSENEQKKNIALLFNINKMSNELASAIRKLDKLQTSNGGWPWFAGMPDDRYITQHIICGFGRLKNLGVNLEKDAAINRMTKKGIDYLDRRIVDDYIWLKKNLSVQEMEKQHIDYTAIHYLYARSFFIKNHAIPASSKEAYNYYFGQAKKYCLKQSRYMQALIALASFRNGDVKIATDIIASFKETAIHNEEMGMYWLDMISGYYWYQAPIETQSLFIELFDEVANDKASVEEMKIWLLKQKQTQNWKTTKATADACYALLLRGGNWLANDGQVTIKIGNILIDPANDKTLVKEAGTGYFKTSWNKDEITKDMGTIKVEKKSDGVAWGAAYWQYFEQLDKITPAQTPLQITKKLYIVTNTDKGQVLTPITAKTLIKVGDKIKVRIEIRTDRNMEYIHLKDMRASGFEPINVLSGYKYQGGLGYYESTGDVATNFFISYLPKGTYVFEYPLRANSAGNFSNGVTSIQCMYAPEFAAHSEGIRISIDGAR
ncbi:MAG: alpha-2-macroglobulin family protein [Bacteroidota bacterium]